MVVRPGATVALHFTARDGEGSVVASSRGGPPVVCVHGEGALVPGLRAALVGRAAGERFDIELAPADGYGERDGTEPVPVPRQALPEGLRPGVAISAVDAGGTPRAYYVAQVDDDVVWVDRNHPLAGRTLTFEVEVVAVR